MNIKIVAFGIARDIFGDSEINFNIEKGTTIAELKEQITMSYPGFKKLVSFSIAVNQSYVPEEYAIESNDEIVIIPPVSGG